MIDISNIQIKRMHRKTMSLQVLSDGSLIVKAPILIPKFIINEFLKKNEEWINKHVGVKKRGNTQAKTYQEGEKFLLLGKEYPLKFENVTGIQISGNFLIFPTALKFRAKKEIENWYIKQAKEMITSQVEKHAKEMQTSYISITYSDTRSKWGSCTHDNRLQFNWRLVMAPPLVIRYVVVHELAHTIEKNHSRVFWKKVASINPSYKEQIKWLKKNGHSVVN